MNATNDEVQSVWAFVTQNPLITISDMAKRMDVSRRKVYLILKFLEDAGYIRHSPHLTGRTVIIPLMVITGARPR